MNMNEDKQGTALPERKTRSYASQYLKLGNTPWAGHLIRIAPPNTHKRKIMVKAKDLYQMLEPFVGFEDWCAWYIEDTLLRINVDYFYTTNHSAIILSISAVQAVLVMNDTDRSWLLFNALSDLINNGFSTNT